MNDNDKNKIKLDDIDKMLKYMEINGLSYLPFDMFHSYDEEE